MPEEKLDLSQKEIVLELGLSLASLIADRESEELFKESVCKLRSSFKDANGIELPLIHIVSNMQLRTNQMRVLVYGKVIRNSFIMGKNRNRGTMLFVLRDVLYANRFYFRKDHEDFSLKLEEMLHEQSYEAYQFLFYYYSNIEPDKKKAFHWLKKLSYYNVPQDIRSLAHCYGDGRGCEIDIVQCNKLLDINRDIPKDRKKF